MSRRRYVEFSPEASSPPIDLTPLIDVVFVVLITFMIIAPFLSLDSIKLAKNHSEKKKEVSPHDVPIAIHLFANGRVKINHKEAEIAQAHALFKELKTKHPDATPLLISDDKAHFGRYLMIKGALEKAGFEKLHLAVDDEASS